MNYLIPWVLRLHPFLPLVGFFEELIGFQWQGLWQLEFLGLKQ
jgi:hypothetical protein